MCPYVIKQREVELGLVHVFSVYFPDCQQGLYIFHCKDKNWSVHLAFLLPRGLMNPVPTDSRYCFHPGLLCQPEDNTPYKPLAVYLPFALNSMSLRG